MKLTLYYRVLYNWIKDRSYVILYRNLICELRYIIIDIKMYPHKMEYWS
ncbi:MAG: hypothetical protein K0R05_4638 [Anaerocolumna sp.]|jgi:hypothetical protein|nr:hypothetical protein [Anaerocolumna sp.]